MSDFIEEIKQEVANEKWAALWKKYQNHILGGIATLLLASAAFVWWQNHQKSAAMGQSDLYIRAVVLSESDPKSALKLFERIPANGETVYATLSRFWTAALLLDQDQKQDAISIYKVIEHKNSGLFASQQKKVFAHMARVRRALLVVDTSPTEALTMVQPFLNEKNPWHLLAWEISALCHIKEKNPEKAESFLQKIIKSPDAKPETKLRAQSLISTLKN